MLSQVSSESSSASPSRSALLDRKIEEATAGLGKSFSRQISSIGENNSTIIVRYVDAMKHEVNPADHYRKDLIALLCRLSKYHNNKSLKEMSRDDILEFLDTCRRTEIQDPMHKWIGTYNLFRMILVRFFKWILPSPMTWQLALGLE